RDGGPRDRHEVVHREGAGQGGVQGGAGMSPDELRLAPHPHATADEVAAAFKDPKLANILYHDWEAGTYDEKWSISFDERCIEYARDRFEHVAGRDGWPYAKSLELGCGTGFFTLYLKLAGVLSEGHVTALSQCM